MQFPKSLSPKATKQFERIRRGVENVGDHNQHLGPKGVLPLSVECVGEITEGDYAGTKQISFAHYYEHPSGDLLVDCEVVFLVFKTGAVFPAYYKQDALGIERTYMEIEGNKIKFSPRMQADLVGFCSGTWFPNILSQNEVPE